MVSAILKNGVRTIIIEGLDRLAREYLIQEILLIYLASKDIALISARTDEDVTEAIMADSMRKALVQIQGVFAELEKNLLVKKLKTARANKGAATGKCKGRKGYRDGGALDVRRLHRKPSKAGIKRKTYREISDILNESGRTTMDGKPFTTTNVGSLLHRLKGRV
jgi:DNA invertase Pin-like site-specific DNA recombinase